MAVTKPSYTRMLVDALVASPPLYAMTFTDICRAIDTKYGRCSAKCLRKAVLRARASEDVLFEGDEVSDDLRVMLCARRRKLARRRTRRAQRLRPKPKTAYNMYVREQIPLRRTTGTEIVTGIMREIAGDWATVGEERRGEYQRMADAENQSIQE